MLKWLVRRKGMGVRIGSFFFNTFLLVSVIEKSIPIAAKLIEETYMYTFSHTQQIMFTNILIYVLFQQIVNGR